MTKPIRQLFTRVASMELLAQVVILLVLLGTWGFIWLANEMRQGDTQRFDERAVRALRRADDPNVPIGPPWVQTSGRDITALGGFAVLIMLIFAVAGFLVMRRQRHAALFVLLAALSGQGVSVGLKHLFNRPRPKVVPHLTFVDSYSFPSGHSMMSAVVYLTLGMLLARFVAEKRAKAYVISLAVIVMVLVGISRVYMGVHYPSDVLAGWTAGSVWALVCWLVARHLQRRGTVEESNGVEDSPEMRAS